MIYEYRKIQPKLKISEKISKGQGAIVLPVGSEITLFLDTVYNKEEYDIFLNLGNGLSLVNKVSDYEYVVRVDSQSYSTAYIGVVGKKRGNPISSISNTILLVGAPKGLIKSSSGEVLSSSNGVLSSGLCL